jgi:hypothetical protein
MEHMHRFFANLGGPEPLPTKVRLFTKNMWYKITHRVNCCGHPGEPGC